MMVKKEKKRGFIGRIKDGFSAISHIVTAGIYPPIAEGAEMLMNNIDDRLRLIEKRILRKLSSLLIIWLGGVFLVFALFFLLRDYLHWTNTAAFFSIGITIFIVGLLLKLGESDRSKNG